MLDFIVIHFNIDFLLISDKGYSCARKKAENLCDKEKESKLENG